MNKKPLSGQKVFIASYTHIAKGIYTTLGGPALAVKDYLKEQVRLLVCVWQPLTVSDTLSVIEEVFIGGKLTKRRKFYVINWPYGRKKEISLIYILTKARDVITTFYFALKSNQHFDIFIGVESLNAIVGVILRTLGIVKKVVYYNLDYGEIRFINPMLNYIFHSLDKLAVNHADYSWSLCKEMIDSRRRKGILHNQSSAQLVVPIGINTNRIKPLPKTQIDRTAIAYLGILSDKQGVQLIAEAMPAVIAKRRDAKFFFIGSGPFEDKLKYMIQQSGLENNATFTGLISDEEVEALLCKCAIGVAPYFPDPNSTKKFTEPTKPKMYLACGLPTIITRVPPIASEIEKQRLGITINYDTQELAEAILKLLNEESTFDEFRNNAISFSSKYDWQHILDYAFSRLQE